jgi:hypothetical protein
LEHLPEPVRKRDASANSTRAHPPSLQLLPPSISFRLTFRIFVVLFTWFAGSAFAQRLFGRVSLHAPRRRDAPRWLQGARLEVHYVAVHRF